jgi:hypothetical protein
MPVASEANRPPGGSQRSEGCTGSDGSRDINNAMLDAPTQPNTETTTPLECQLPSILIDYERINTYLTENGAPEDVVDALDRITCLAKDAESIESAIQKLQLAITQAQPTPSAAPANTQRTSYSTAVRKGLLLFPSHSRNQSRRVTNARSLSYAAMRRTHKRLGPIRRLYSK